MANLEKCQAHRREIDNASLCALTQYCAALAQVQSDIAFNNNPSNTFKMPKANMERYAAKMRTAGCVDSNKVDAAIRAYKP